MRVTWYLLQAFILSNTLNHSLGPVDQSTVAKVEVQITDEEKTRLKRMEARPQLSEILNLHDFEVKSTRLWGQPSLIRHETGYCSAGYAGESVGLLLFRRRRRNHEQRESRRVSQVGCYWSIVRRHLKIFGSGSGSVPASCEM